MFVACIKVEIPLNLINGLASQSYFFYWLAFVVIEMLSQTKKNEKISLVAKYFILHKNHDCKQQQQDQKPGFGNTALVALKIFVQKCCR